MSVPDPGAAATRWRQSGGGRVAGRRPAWTFSPWTKLPQRRPDGLPGAGGRYSQRVRPHHRACDIKLGLLQPDVARRWPGMPIWLSWWLRDAELGPAAMRAGFYGAALGQFDWCAKRPRHQSRSRGLDRAPHPELGELGRAPVLLIVDR